MKTAADHTGAIATRGGRNPAEQASRGDPSPAEQVTRVVCHAVAEVPFLLVALVQIVQGWRPSGDEAIISIRSWAVFTSHSPLLGEFTTVSGCTRHVAFDPGPLLFWMLALPVRMDPAHGVLWGAAVWCAVAMAVCVEAAWAVRRATGAIAVAGFAVVLAATQPDVLVNSDWNPHFGLVWFAATCAVAWAVGTGHLRWWPVLVLTASIAAQCHLTYTLPAVLLAVLAPLPHVRRWLGGTDGRAWLPAGLCAGAACWGVPIVQQLTGRPGNVSVLLRCVGGHVMGGRFGLQTLASAVVPPPLWFHGPPGSAHALLKGLTAHSAGVGIAVLTALAVVAVGAWTARRKDLAVLAGVALLVAGSTAWEIALQPTSNAMALLYVETVLWPVGMMIWGVAALAVVEVVARWGVLSRPRGWLARASSPARPEHGRRRIPRWRPGAALLWSAAGAVLVGGTVNAVILAGGAMNQAAREDGGRGAFHGFSAAAAAAERLVPRGPLGISVFGRDADTSLDLLYGTLWVLISQGRQATAAGFFAEMIRPPAYAVPGEPWVSVTVRSDGSVASAVLSSRSSR